MSSVSTAKTTKNMMVENSAWRSWESGCAAYADPQTPKIDAVARPRNSMQFRGMNIFQSPCRANTNKPVKTTLKAMQLANTIIAGLKSAATAICGACRALWIKKAIIARYETIIASTNRRRRAPNLLAVTRSGTTSMVLSKLAPPALVHSPRIICDRADSG
jgi:hypothetical protein